MKRITIRDLHMRTGHCVREAATSEYVVTERGRPVAMLVPWRESARTRPLPDREAGIARMPRIDRGSEILVREERDRR
jgi:prevent-host-death family protein